MKSLPFCCSFTSFSGHSIYPDSPDLVATQRGLCFIYDTKDVAYFLFCCKVVIYLCCLQVPVKPGELHIWLPSVLWLRHT